MRHRYLMVLMACLCALVMPSLAYADDGSIVGGFVSGIETWNQQSDGEQEVRQVTEDETVRANGDEPTIVGYIEQYVNGAKVNFNGSNYVMFKSVATPRLLLLIIVPTAVLLVFFWWGLRKAGRMLMAAFRRGRIST